MVGTLLVVDGHYMLHRTLHISSFATLSFQGQRTGGVFGTLKAIQKAVEGSLPNRVVYVWDGGQLSARRLSLCPEYKQHRVAPEPTEEDLFYRDLFREQKQLLESILWRFGVESVRSPEHEGDDMVAHVVRLYDGPCVIVSDDKDMLQLVGPRVKVYRPIKEEWVTEKNFLTRVGVPAHYFLFEKAILGDPSDNISGAPGVGPKTLEILWAELASAAQVFNLDSLLLYCEDHANSRVRKIAECRAVLQRNLEMIDLSLEPLDEPAEQALRVFLRGERMYSFNEGAVREALSQLGFQSLFQNFSAWSRPFVAM